MTRKQLASLLAAIVLPALPGCGDAPQGDQDETVDSNESASYVWRGTTWTDLGVSTIPVCWVNPNDVTAEVRDAVKGILETEYHGRTAVRFSGFGACAPADAQRTMVRARFETTRTTNNSHPGGQSWVGPVSRALGGESTATMWFGAPSDWRRSEWLKNATLSAALHEFGHAIGLLHEHERSDAAGCDATPAQVPSNNASVKVGPYDADSIMNYCRTDRRPTLSAGDVAGIATLFDGSPAQTPPTFSSYSPGRVYAGSAAFDLRVTGGNFGPTTRVTLDGQEAATTLVDATQVRARVPADKITAPRTIYIGVQNGNARARGQGALRVVAR